MDFLSIQKVKGGTCDYTSACQAECYNFLQLPERLCRLCLVRRLVAEDAFNRPSHTVNRVVTLVVCVGHQLKLSMVRVIPLSCLYSDALLNNATYLHPPPYVSSSGEPASQRPKASDTGPDVPMWGALYTSGLQVPMSPCYLKRDACKHEASSMPLMG